MLMRKLLPISVFYHFRSKFRMLHSGYNDFRDVQMTGLAENKIKVDGIEINCLQTGSGEHNVLCLPGLLGTIWTDFSPQIVGFNPDEFSMIVWDPPGYGNSRPPERDFTPGYLERDADLIVKLLKALNISKCSLLGWSDGGISALVLSAKYPNIVDKVVIWGANAYVTDEDIVAYEKIRDINSWSVGMKNTMINIYGEKKFSKMVSEWVDSMRLVKETKDGNLCRDLVPMIKVPTMIFHGAKDPLVPRSHPEFLHKNIKNSTLHMLQDGKHNIHLKFAEFFNKVTQTFLQEK